MRSRLLSAAPALTLASFVTALAAAPAMADPCHHKGPVEQCLKKGGDLLTCSCLNGGPCDGALFTIACGHDCDTLGQFDNTDPVDVSIDFYDDKGKLLYRDDGAFAIARDGHDGGIVLMATGNLVRAEFQQWFRGANAPLSKTSGLVLKVYNMDAKGKRRLVVAGPNVVYAHALYADYCGNAPVGQLSMEDETARAMAAEAALEAEIQQEIADRAAGDSALSTQLAAHLASINALQTSLTAETTRALAAEQQLEADLAAEIAARQAGDTALQNALDSEIAARQAGDTALQNALNSEIAARKQGDLDTLATANLYTDNAVAAEAAARAAADQTIQASVTALGNSLRADLQRETEDREATDAALQQSINAVSTALGQETTDRQSGDAALQAGLATLTTGLSDEITRAQSVESTLFTSLNTVSMNLSGEVARAQSAEAALQAGLAAEIARAQGTESSLLATINATGMNLANEITRAQAAEAALSGGINSLGTSLNAETSARTAADQALINAITGVQNNLGIFQSTLASLGVPNDPGNPVDWSQLKNVPPTLLLGGSGITSLNGLVGASQSLAVGAAGVAPGWSSVGGVHTLNLPIASLTATGVISGTSDLFIRNQIAAAQSAQFLITSSDVTRTARASNTTSTGYAMYGLNTATAGIGTGGGFFGSTAQAGGLGLLGTNTNASGTGVYGAGQNVSGSSLVTGSGGAFSGYDTGLFAYASTFGVGQAIYTNLDGFITRVNYFSGTTQYKIQGVGTVSTLVKDPNGRTVTMHAPETPEIYLQDFGEGRLVNGRAHVELDPTFARNVTINERHPLRVFIQLEDNEDILGVVVKNKTDHGFDVVELGGGRSNTPFQWQITCNRADEDYGNGRVSRNADQRFEPAADPIPQATPPESMPSGTAAQPSSHTPWYTQAPSRGVIGRVLSALAGPR